MCMSVRVCAHSFSRHPYRLVHEHAYLCVHLCLYEKIHLGTHDFKDFDTDVLTPV